MSQQHTCAACHRSFVVTDPDWIETGAMQEYRDRFPDDDGTDLAVLCDECYDEFIAWLEAGRRSVIDTPPL